MSLEGARTLTKHIPGVISTLSDGPPVSFDVTGNGWTRLGAGTNYSVVYRDYYDLNMLTLEDLSLFFSNVDIQEEFTPYGLAGCHIIDLITTERLSDDDITSANIVEATALDDLVGFINSTMNLEQVVYGRTRWFRTQANIPSSNTLAGTTNWGACLATTGRKLFLTRIVYVDPNIMPPQGVIIPPCNYVTSGIITKEPDLEYIMRMKRSYEQVTV